MAGYIDGPVPAFEVLAGDKGSYEGRLAVVGSSITPQCPAELCLFQVFHYQT
jgi:hypothetical protein